MRLFSLFGGSSMKEPAAKLYVTLVEQARMPGFYLECGVPDTVDGRFDMVVLHVFLVLRRLKRGQEDSTDLAQALFDIMFADMDQNLREMGVGDLGVGKRIKTMADAFYGRVAAYEAGLDGDDGVLADALGRNLFRKTTPAPENVASLVRYMRRETAGLDAMAFERLLAGEVGFGSPPGPGQYIPPDTGKEKGEEVS